MYDHTALTNQASQYATPHSAVPHASHHKTWCVPQLTDVSHTRYNGSVQLETAAAHLPVHKLTLTWH